MNWLAFNKTPLAPGGQWMNLGAGGSSSREFSQGTTGVVQAKWSSVTGQKLDSNGLKTE